MATVITVTHNLHPSKPIPLWVQVSWGRGTGSLGIPQGYPCQSLVLFGDTVTFSKFLFLMLWIVPLFGTLSWDRLPPLLKSHTNWNTDWVWQLDEQLWCGIPDYISRLHQHHQLMASTLEFSQGPKLGLRPSPWPCVPASSGCYLLILVAFFTNFLAQARTLTK